MKSFPALLLAASALIASARADDSATVPAPLTLGHAIDAVLARYPSIEAAQAEVDAARARTTQSDASRLTQVSAQGAYTYNSLRPYVPFPNGSGGTSDFYETIHDSYNASITVRQLLTDFGRTDAIVELSRTGELSARDALEATRQQLGYQTIQAFYGVLLLRQSVGVANDEITSLREALRIAERKFSAGSATKFDVLTTQVRLANAANRLADTTAMLEKQESAMRQLLGSDRGSRLELTGDLDGAVPALDESSVIAEGLQHRPEMKLAHDNEQGARLRLDAADRANRPTLEAQASGGLEDGDLPAMYDNKGYVRAGVSMTVPLLTGRRITGERVEARAGIRSAQARIRELNATIVNDVENAFADLTAARARLSGAGTLVDQSQEALALAKTRYANGVITNFELLDAQSAARSAELTRLQARYDCVLAGQAVARAAGRPPQP